MPPVRFCPLCCASCGAPQSTDLASITVVDSRVVDAPVVTQRQEPHRKCKLPWSRLPHSHATNREQACCSEDRVGHCFVEQTTEKTRLPSSLEEPRGAQSSNTRQEHRGPEDHGTGRGARVQHAMHTIEGRKRAIIKKSVRPHWQQD